MLELTRMIALRAAGNVAMTFTSARKSPMKFFSRAQAPPSMVPPVKRSMARSSSFGLLVNSCPESPMPRVVSTMAAESFGPK